MKKYWILFVIPLLMSVTCQNNGVLPAPKEHILFKSGHNFGMCLGKCYHELIFDKDKITFVQKELSYPGKFETFEWDVTANVGEYQDLVSDFNKEKFMSLDDIIGCPDCADGGSEWLEIIVNSGKTKRVTFEYGKEPPGFEELVKKLREHRLGFINKHQ